MWKTQTFTWQNVGNFCSTALQPSCIYLLHFNFVPFFCQVQHIRKHSDVPSPDCQSCLLFFFLQLCFPSSILAKENYSYSKISNSQSAFLFIFKNILFNLQSVFTVRSELAAPSSISTHLYPIHPSLFKHEAVFSPVENAATMALPDDERSLP